MYICLKNMISLIIQKIGQYQWFLISGIKKKDKTKTKYKNIQVCRGDWKWSILKHLYCSLRGQNIYYFKNFFKKVW